MPKSRSIGVGVTHANEDIIVQGDGIRGGETRGCHPRLIGEVPAIRFLVPFPARIDGLLQLGRNREAALLAGRGGSGSLT